MVEESVGDFLQDVAVVEGFVEGRDLGERLGLIRGHFSQERALFQGPCHRREPVRPPVEYFGDLVGLGIVVTQIEIGAVERGHGAFDRNDIVVRIGVGVLRERRGDILLDGAVAPVDRGVDRLVEGQACRRSTALTLSPMMNASKSKPVWETVIVCSAMLALPSPAVMVIVAEREDASGLIMEETSRPSSVRFTVSQSLPSVRVYSHSKLDSTLSSLALVGVAANGTVFSDVLMNAARSCVTRIVSETGFPPPCRQSARR